MPLTARHELFAAGYHRCGHLVTLSPYCVSAVPHALLTTHRLSFTCLLLAVLHPLPSYPYPCATCSTRLPPTAHCALPTLLPPDTRHPRPAAAFAIPSHDRTLPSCPREILRHGTHRHLRHPPYGNYTSHRRRAAPPCDRARHRPTTKCPLLTNHPYARNGSRTRNCPIWSRTAHVPYAAPGARTRPPSAPPTTHDSRPSFPAPSPTTCANAGRPSSSRMMDHAHAACGAPPTAYDAAPAPTHPPRAIDRAPRAYHRRAHLVLPATTLRLSYLPAAAGYLTTAHHPRAPPTPYHLPATAHGLHNIHVLADYQAPAAHAPASRPPTPSHLEHHLTTVHRPPPTRGYHLLLATSTPLNARYHAQLPPSCLPTVRCCATACCFLPATR